LASGKAVAKDDKKVICLASSGQLLASCFYTDPEISSLVEKGLEEFSSLTAHKFLRWQIKTGFENWLYRKQDPRLIETTGGYEGIAGLIGCGRSHKAIGIVKALLHAQAYARFSFCDGSIGNLIILRETKLHRNGHPSALNLILGEVLLPNYTHLLPKGEKRRLIPMPILPPMIGSKNSHAAQAFLQLLVLEEFSDQSKLFIKKESFALSQDKWWELGMQAGLSRSTLASVINGWEKSGFLKKAGKEEGQYVLGERYYDLSVFLELQGKARNHRANTFKKSGPFLRSPNAFSVRSPNFSAEGPLTKKSARFVFNDLEG
jgi:hypothetical protein